MNRKEDGIAVIAAVLLMAMLGVFLLASCTTTKKAVEKVVETEYVHDTVYSHSTDTVYKERIVHQKDTVRESVEKLVTLVEKEPGRVDTVRIETLRDTYHGSALTDTTKQLINAVESLIKVLDRQKDTSSDKEVVKQAVTFPWKWLCIGLLCFIACLIVLTSKSK